MKNLMFLLWFFVGFFSCASLFILGFGLELPFAEGTLVSRLEAPSDKIDDSAIEIFDDKVVLHIAEVSLSGYAATGSMKPVFDAGANGLRVKPESVDDIEIGDIISFRKGNYLIVHRVVDKGSDDRGVYFITKGDNSDFVDGKVRFEDIEYLTVGVIW